MSDGFAVSMFGALFAVMNPFVNLPIFLSLTEDQTRSDQRKTAIQVVIYTAACCGVVAVGGSAILNFFDISVDAFRVAGGLVLLQIGFHMLNGRESPAHHGTESEQANVTESESIAFYPMTFPMLVGPGTMTTLILFAHNAQGSAGWAAYALCVGAVIAILAVVLFFAGDIGQYLSRTARTIMTRLMGMILLAIAIGMVTAGAKVLLPGLA
ncbi:MarC family protein [Shimia thalassica]|mgnify:FL=1|uniref:MarC family protein n=1 Tax=Shimia thalassica TaxID=1715693 RepID=UPI0027371A6F|nr:MarC family protein [Shimia thalassica]MDP2580849.1 MarC family protein [Shimia thalassica]